MVSLRLITMMEFAYGLFLEHHLLKQNECKDKVHVSASAVVYIRDNRILVYWDRKSFTDNLVLFFPNSIYSGILSHNTCMPVL